MTSLMLYVYWQTVSLVVSSFRYIAGSTKEATRWKREKGASRVFKLKNPSRLPAQSLLFSVTSNKVQIIDMIIQDLIAHRVDRVAHSLVVTGPDPVPVEIPGPLASTATGILIDRHDLRTTQEEADTIIVQQVSITYIFLSNKKELKISFHPMLWSKFWWSPYCRLSVMQLGPSLLSLWLTTLMCSLCCYTSAMQEQ